MNGMPGSLRRSACQSSRQSEFCPWVGPVSFCIGNSNHELSLEVLRSNDLKMHDLPKRLLGDYGFSRL